MTKKQKVLYTEIVKFINQKKYSPTIRELCEIIGVSSPNTIHKKLKSLKEEGYISYIENKARTIRVLKK